MLPHLLKNRLKAYFEITLVSFLFFVVAGGSGMAASLLWRKVFGGQTLAWQIAVAFIAVFLLPYLVLAARVWDVKLSILGAQADKVSAESELSKSRPPVQTTTLPKPEDPVE